MKHLKTTTVYLAEAVPPTLLDKPRLYELRHDSLLRITLRSILRPVEVPCEDSTSNLPHYFGSVSCGKNHRAEYEQATGAMAMSVRNEAGAPDPLTSVPPASAPLDLCSSSRA
jgi:hypothetical protein